MTADHNKHIVSEIAAKNDEIATLKVETATLHDTLRSKIDEVDQGVKYSIEASSINLSLIHI